MCWHYADYFAFIIPLHFPTVIAHKGVKSKQKNDLKLLGQHLALDTPSMNIAITVTLMLLLSSSPIFYW